MKLLISLLFLVCMGASAQEPLKIVLTTGGPGGGPDTAARFLQESLSAQLEYRPGAGGMVGLTSVAKASPEHQILCMTTVTMLVQSLSAQATFDVKQFAPISYIRVPFVLLVSPKLNIKNLKDLQQYKGQPLSYGSNGVGTITHVLGEQLSKNTKQPMTHVPFKAPPEIMQALVGGHIDLAFIFYPGVKGLMEAQKLIPLAIDLPQRHSDWPNLPTFNEFQLTQLANISYVLLVSNQVTDRSKITATQKTVANALQDKTLIDKFEKNGFTVDKNQLVLSPDFLLKEQQRMSKVLKDLNLNVN